MPRTSTARSAPSMANGTESSTAAGSDQRKAERDDRGLAGAFFLESLAYPFEEIPVWQSLSRDLLDGGDALPGADAGHGGREHLGRDEPVEAVYLVGSDDRLDLQHALKRQHLPRGG